MVLGLDIRFLGGKWRKKNNGDCNGSGISHLLLLLALCDGLVDWVGKRKWCTRAFSAAGGEQAKAMQEGSVGWEPVVVEKRISPLRRSQKRDRFRSK